MEISQNFVAFSEYMNFNINCFQFVVKQGNQLWIYVPYKFYFYIATLIICLLFFRPKSPPNTPNPELASSFHNELKAVYINHLVNPDEEQDDFTASNIMLGLKDQSQIISEAVRPSFSSSGLTR